MSGLSDRERTQLSAISDLVYCNPFIPERVEIERRILGSAFVPGEPVWSRRVEDPPLERANAVKIWKLVESMAEGLRARVAARKISRTADLVLYEDAILHLLYNRSAEAFWDAAFGETGPSPSRWDFHAGFRRDWQHFFFVIPRVTFPTGHEPEHTFACFYQVRRAFHHIFTHIIGSSMPAARLRGAVWESIFTCDMRRYRRSLYSRMADFATLISGPSGTGKELVARAITHSRFVPFDEKRRVFDDPTPFRPINIGALPATLVESELFGHRRGAFTGAWQDRNGYLETCPALGTVFLDEIGELEPSVQVKLLRVIETRSFQPLGDNTTRQFQGKIIAATNRNLADEIAAGRFREDLYYRLCSDLITTPSLAEQLRESPQVLRELVLHMAQRVAGPDASGVAQQAERWITKHLDGGYPWPGNYRELEQCVRNVLIRNEYRPATSGGRKAAGWRDEWMGEMVAGTLTADALVRRYASLIYSRTRSYEETARRLGLDRRTVKAKIDRDFLARVTA